MVDRMVLDLEQRIAGEEPHHAGICHRPESGDEKGGRCPGLLQLADDRRIVVTLDLARAESCGHSSRHVSVKRERDFRTVPRAVVDDARIVAHVDDEDDHAAEDEEG